MSLHQCSVGSELYSETLMLLLHYFQEAAIEVTQVFKGISHDPSNRLPRFLFYEKEKVLRTQLNYIYGL